MRDIQSDLQERGTGSMAQAHSKRVWHLSRRDERPCVLSDQELLLLAELGHLRADDLLWRPGFDGYRAVRSLLGQITIPALPSHISLSERQQISVKATPLLSRYQKRSGSSGLIETTAASQRLRTATLEGANRHIKLVDVVGLLVVVIFVGVLGLAMHKSLATDPQPALQYSTATELYSAATELSSASTEAHSTSTEPQQPKSKPPSAERPSGFTDQAELEQGGVIVRTVRVFSIDVPQPSDASALVPNHASDGPSNSVPLPNRKPVRPIKRLNAEGEVRVRSAVSGRVSQAPLPKPMGFGPFGFNNSEN